MPTNNLRRALFAATFAAATAVAGSALAAKVAVITPYLAQPGTQFYVEAFQGVAKDKGWDVNVTVFSVQLVLLAGGLAATAA